MYTCVLNPSYTDEEFDRVFNDSWSSMSEQFGGDSQDAVRNRHRARVKRMDQIVAVYKDGYMISLFSGAVEGSTFRMTFALFGKTQDNSKAYIHSTDYLKAINDAFKTKFTDVLFITVKDSSIDSYRVSIQPQTETLIGDLIRDDSVEEEGVTYHVTKHSY